MNKLSKAMVTGGILGLAYMASDRSTKNKMKKDGRKMMKRASNFMEMF